MFDTAIMRQPGRPCASSREGSMPKPTEEGDRQMGSSRESDGSVVPMKAGNVAGGKGATYGSAK
jgi:hypothetical protein